MHFLDTSKIDDQMQLESCELLGCHNKTCKWYKSYKKSDYEITYIHKESNHKQV